MSSELTKEQLINREKRRLRLVYRELDKNKLKTVESLIATAAFMTVSLKELEHIINATGYVETYKNGANQTGKKQSEAVKTHIAMTKNLTVIIRQLADLAPPATNKSKLKTFMDNQ